VLHAMLISVACHFLLSCRPSADLLLRWKSFNSFSYPQSPITHWRVLLPIPLRAKISETLPVVVINEQGEEEKN
jgi:hypothetical protein